MAITFDTLNDYDACVIKARIEMRQWLIGEMELMANKKNARKTLLHSKNERDKERSPTEAYDQSKTQNE